MKILIVGHGEYASGVKSTMKLLTGVDEKIYAINLNDEITHDQYKEMVCSYVEKNDELIIFADLTGGSPFQIAAEQILLNKSNTQYIVGGVSVGCMLDIIMNTIVIDTDTPAIDVIKNAVNQLQDMTSIIKGA